MNLETCLEHLVGAPGTVPFNNMIMALQMHSWLNTPEEKLRLEAALYARRHKKEVLAALNRKRDLRYRRK